MKELRSGGPQLFEAFLKSAQYLVRLQTQQDLWEHLGRFVLTHFPASWVAVVERDSTHGLSFRYCTLPEVFAAQNILTAEVRTLIADILESGFLASRVLSTPTPSMTAFVPISENYQTNRVMLIGHNDAQPLSNELLNIYLALAGLAGTTAERRQAEVSVQKERQRLHDVLETLPVMVFLLTPDYHVTFANKRFREQFGEARGRRCHEYMFGCTKPCEFCETFEALKTGAPHHWERKSPDGQRSIDVYALPFTDFDGSPLILEMDVDITEMREAQAALKEANETLEQRVAERTAQLKKVNDELRKEIVERARAEQHNEFLASIIECTTQPFCVGYPDGRLGMVNHAFEQLTGYTANELRSLDWAKTLTPPEWQEIEQKKLEELQLAGGPVRYEKEYIRKDGSRLPIELLVHLVTDAEGKPQYYYSFLTDITERKRAEQALLRGEKLASVGRMAATIAHEINNPLEAVTNLLFLAKTSDELPESVCQYLEMAEAELKRVAHITRQSLGFYRESNAPQLTSITAVLDSAVDLMKSKIKAKHAVIEKQWNTEVQVTAVASELRQVFSNLLANSLDAIEEKGIITLRVSTGGIFRNGIRHVRITVADNGSGISATARHQIFEPFFTTKDTVGTGLGLWVSKQIIDKHAGSIRVRSSRDGSRRGTVVLVVLPVEAAAAVHTQSAGA